MPDYVAVVEAALRAHGPEIGAEMWYTHRDAAEVAIRALTAAGLLRRDYDQDEEGVR